MAKRTLRALWLALTLTAVSSCGAAMSDRQRWAIEAFRAYGPVQDNLTYVKVDGVEVSLDVYSPAAPARTPRPTLVWLHGGGYFRGSKARDSLRLLPWLVRGWSVVNVEYRLRQVASAPAAAEDVRCALKWVFANGGKYGFDLDKVVLSGSSAGGHLSMLAGLATAEAGLDRNCPDGPQPRVAAIVAWYGFADLRTLAAGPTAQEYVAGWFAGAPAEPLASRLSPVSYVRPGAPPLVSVHGERDSVHPFAHITALHRGLTDAQVPNLLHVVRGRDTPDFTLEDDLASYQAIFDFLRAQRVE